MRKVKVLALLLAALMVVAVFAGCADTDAIVADVDSLEDRVTALEGLLNDQKDAIDDVKDQIGDVSDKLDDDTTADQLAATLEALKQLQEAMNAQNEQIKDLADKVTKVEEDAKESDENADDDAALEAAVKVYTAQLQELKIACELKKDLYILADYEAVVKALSDGIVAVAAAEKADDAKAAFEAAKAVYDAKAIVSSKLAAFYAQVNNSITADSKALIDEIRAYIYDDTTKTPVAKCPVTVKYGKDANGKDVDPATLTIAQASELFVANIYGEKNADGTVKLVNVVAELQKAVAAYDYIANANKANTFANKVKAAIDEIAKIKTVTFNEDIKAAKDAYAAVVTDIVALDANKDGETDNKQYAPFLADSIMAQVTNAADLTAAEARILELAVAHAMYDTYVALATGTVGKIFKTYTDLSDTEKVLYTNKPVYDAIDAILNKWADAYKLEAENVELIVNDKEGTDFYYGYLKNKLETELSVKAYTDFAAIANRIAALNKLTTVNAANVTEYGDIAKAIKNWVVLQKASTAENATRLEREPLNLSVANIEKILKAYEMPVTALTFDDKGNLTNMFALCQFKDTEVVGAFFKDKYADLKSEYEAINNNIKTLAGDKTASSKYTDIKRYVDLEGIYESVAGVYSKKVVDVADTANIDGTANETGSKNHTSLTIAAFLKKYEKYDLSSLINLADFEAAKAFTTDRIAGFKAGAANIKTLVEAVDYVALVKTSDVAYAAAQKDAAVGTVYYYVNLADVDAVAKANKAYTEWINQGATSQLQEWVLVLDEDGEVEVDANGDAKYEFAPITDAEALRALKQMNEDIAKLQSVAAKVVAHFELIAEIWNQNKAMALNATAEQNTEKVDVLTLVKATLDAGLVDKVSYAYNVTLSNSAATSFTFAGRTYTLASKTMVKTADITSGEVVTTNLQELINEGYAAYQAFLSMNAEIKVKLDGSTYKKDSVKKLTYADVENAIKGIAAAELVMIKDWAMDTLKKTPKLDATTVDYYCNWINGVTTINDTTGNSLWTVAQEIYAKTQVQLADYTRGAEIEVWDTGISDYTQVFRAPVYENLG